MRLGTGLSALLLLLPGALAAPRQCKPKASQAPSPSASAAVEPSSAAASALKTVVLDPKQLLEVKAGLKDDNPVLKTLLGQADVLVTKGEWTVTSKLNDVPQGTKHDYASRAPYWWSTSDTDPEACPYEQRDGQRNPQVDVAYTDRRGASNMMNSTYTLALAWFYTGKDEYRTQAGKVVRTWFLDEETKMTPHLQHAQIIPCKTNGDENGRFIGIIDFSQQYTEVIDAVAILATQFDDAWSEADDKAFRAWNTEFLTWLSESDFGAKELAKDNNHGVFARMQIAALAQYLGKTDLAKKMVNGVFKESIDKYIKPDGIQPQEIDRKTPWHYTTFTLMAYTRLCLIAKPLGIDVWGYVGSDGQSIQKAIEWMLPYATGKEEWTYPEEHPPIARYAAYEVVRFAADWGMEAAKAAVSELEKAKFTGDLWELRPAPSQLDSIIFTQK